MAVTMLDVMVENVIPESVEDAVGTVRDYVRVHYKIGEYGPYSILIPKLEMSAQRVLMDVRTDAQKYLDVLNLQFS